MPSLHYRLNQSACRVTFLQVQIAETLAPPVLTLLGELFLREVGAQKSSTPNRLLKNDSVILDTTHDVMEVLDLCAADVTHRRRYWPL